jgi:hypothetical protein
MKRRILTVLVIVSVTSMLFGFAATPAMASHRVVVTVSGRVTLVGDGLVLQVGAQASGPASSLTGQGFDGPVPGTPIGYCTIALTSGSLSGDVVTLSGPVIFSNDPVNLDSIGNTFVANASNGSITFTFDTTGALGGPFVFTGTGRVVIAHS